MRRQHERTEPAALAEWVAAAGTRFAAVASAAIAENGFSRRAVADALEASGFEHAAERKVAALDLVLWCAQQVIADHALTVQELQSIRTLKQLFSIEEGAFWEHRRHEVAEVLKSAMQVILHDRVVTGDEAKYKVGLQELFGLGYDEFLQLIREPMREAIGSLIDEMDPEGQGLSPGQLVELQHRITHLDTVLLLDINSSDGIIPAGRYIPPHVKDAVWRRDQGRCATCGSNERLEFDHIIPHARGGSNTYRNVQLLCEPCNRSKSDGLY